TLLNSVKYLLHKHIRFPHTTRLRSEKQLTVTISTTYYGIRYLFKPYNIDINEVTKDPDILVNYSAKIKKELFFDTKPDQSFVNRSEEQTSELKSRENL